MDNLIEIDLIICLVCVVIYLTRSNKRLLHRLHKYEQVHELQRQIISLMTEVIESFRKYK